MNSYIVNHREIWPDSLRRSILFSYQSSPRPARAAEYVSLFQLQLKIQSYDLAQQCNSAVTESVRTTMIRQQNK